MIARKTKALTTTTQNKAVLIHATRINQAWQKAVSSIIETGQLLIDAKEGKNKLQHGEFTKLFDPQIGKLPFSERTAQQLMQIARHAVLANPSYRSALPPHWRTLAILSRAPGEQLEQWLADKTVTAETEQVEAIVLLSPPAPAVEPTKSDFTSKTERKYTNLIQRRKLYEGACKLSWAEYFEFREAHPDCTPLTSDDLAYAGQWTKCATQVEPAPSRRVQVEVTDHTVREAVPYYSRVSESEAIETEDNDSDDSDSDVSPPQLDNPSHLQVRQCIRQLHELIGDSSIDWTAIIEGVGSEKIRDIIEKLKPVLAAAEARKKKSALN
jgi:hypothetical protein